MTSFTPVLCGPALCLIPAIDMGRLAMHHHASLSGFTSSSSSNSEGAGTEAANVRLAVLQQPLPNISTVGLSISSLASQIFMPMYCCSQSLAVETIIVPP
jgi:hypothetical protein